MTTQVNVLDTGAVVQVQYPVFPIASKIYLTPFHCVSKPITFGPFVFLLLLLL